MTLETMGQLSAITSCVTVTDGEIIVVYQTDRRLWFDEVVVLSIVVGDRVVWGYGICHGFLGAGPSNLYDVFLWRFAGRQNSRGPDCRFLGPGSRLPLVSTASVPAWAVGLLLFPISLADNRTPGPRDWTLFSPAVLVRRTGHGV
jgi:hypothetical protein